MAKVWPKIPGKRPGDEGNPPPKKGNPRPVERNETFKEIGNVIITEWIAAVKDKRSLRRDHLETEISKHLEPFDNQGRVEFGIIVDPKPEKNRKFVWIVIPYPDAPKNVDPEDWIDEYNNDKLKTLLGEAVLFGCGR